jgi:hypothetical protein
MSDRGCTRQFSKYLCPVFSPRIIVESLHGRVV